MHLGLMGLKALTWRYEYSEGPDRRQLHEIVTGSFSILFPMIKDIIENRDKLIIFQRYGLQNLYLICKILYKSNQIEMCPYFIKKDIIDPWMQFFIDILDLPLPESLVTLTNDADEIVHRNGNILWKMKGIAGEITQKIFRRYRDPREFENLSNNQNFSKHLIDKWSVPLMNS